MSGNSIIDFFKNGGVYFFDEEDSASERTYYKVEDAMGEEDGADIVETEIDDEGMICVFYDCSVLSEEEVKEKYASGDFSVTI